MAYPMYFVILALIAYGVAYFIYGKWYDRRVWQPDARRTTPAHMYTDGVEYFPVSKAVLWGYQFKSVAALGPILGPFIALTYGWLPALIWIILGNFFIGWLQDYGAIMVSVRNEGRSFGPITYEFTGASGRNTLLGFVLLYLLIISATFLYFIAVFWNVFPSTFVSTLGVFATGVLVGYLLYRQRLGVGPVTLLALVLVVVSILLGRALPMQTNFLGVWTIPFWAAVCCVVLYLASILPLPTFIQPINYVSFFPAFLAIILILVASLISPITNVPIQQAAFKTFFSDGVGPIWPILFVAIACGAISGWHSLVSSSTTSKQLDVEIDAHSVGAGAMLSEGLLALASVAAYTVLSPQELTGITNISAWVNGAVKLTTPFLGGQASAGFLQAYFGLTLVIYALTVQSLVTRFWRLVLAESVGEGSFAPLGQKHVATVVGLVIPLIFASTGSWINLWLYFGGANQLLAGLAIMLITIHLARVRQPTLYTLIPASFMIVTTLAALIWQTWAFTRPVLTALGILQGYKPLIQAGTPLADPSVTGLALVLNTIFILVGLALIWLGVRMALLTYEAYGRYRTGGQQPVARPAPA